MIGVEDLDWGQHVTALVTVRADSDTSVEKIMEHCRAQLASYKKPKDIRIVSEFPLNSTGKIAKKILRADLNAEAVSEQKGKK